MGRGTAMTTPPCIKPRRQRRTPAKQRHGGEVLFLHSSDLEDKPRDVAAKEGIAASLDANALSLLVEKMRSKRTPVDEDDVPEPR